MVRILGTPGRSRRLRSAIGIVACTAIVALIAVPAAMAVHDAGVFQLDKNASTAVDSTPTALEDWDLICKASQPSSTPPGSCVFAPGYTPPAGTTTADPFSFVVDPSQSQQDDILKGGTKDDNDVSSWKWASAKPSPPKNDITDAYAAEYEASGDNLLYFGADRFSNNGAANIAFWFFQNQIKRNPETGACTAGAGCPFTGVHKAGNVSLGGSVPGACGPTPPAGSTCIPGDILIISAFGPHATISVYEWVGVGNAINPPGPEGCLTSVCSLEPLVEGSAACEDATTDNVCATVNDVATPSPWVVQQASGPANQFLPTNFFEGGLNLTALNVDACFSSFLVNTRASASGDAELHDMVLGQFARCEADLTTQASTAGPVTPGTPVHDTATVSISGAANAADPTGTVTFSLCGPDLVKTSCTTGGASAGTGLLGDTDHDGVVDDVTADGNAIALSDDVNTAANPLSPGFYCFRADWPGDTNYPGAKSFTNNTDECFEVAKIPTGTVTTPGTVVGETFTPVTSVSLGTTVFDRAVVTGTAVGGDPTGEVNFFVCTPAQLTPANTGVCSSGGSAVTGNPKTLVSDGVAGTFTSSALSGAFTPAGVGKHCFRAVYGGSTVYLGSSDSSEGECFTVTTTSSATSVQKWLPNDSVTINSGVPLNGTLSITLRTGSCAGTVIYTEPTNQTLTNVASGTTFDTTNTGTFVTAANNATPYFWRAVYTPTSSFVTGVTKCEQTDITINNNP